MFLQIYVVNFQFFYDDEILNNIVLFFNLFMFVSLEKIDYVSLGIFLCDIVYMCIMVRLENFFF